MNNYHKIGFITGVGGNANGIGEYVRGCDAAGVPATIFGCDDIKGIADILALDSSVPHVMGYRVVKDGGEFYSVPNYNLSPLEAAQDYFTRVEPEIHPVVKDNRDKIWIFLGNELDKNRAHWLGQWGVESAKIWNSHGYRVTLFGFSSGEPEPTDWETGGMLDFLRLAAAKPNEISVNLHEYSFDDDDILDIYPWLVGRFQHLFEACDNNNISRLTVLIGEWGWRQDVAPDVGTAAGHIADVANLYAPFNTILGAGIWTLGHWHSNIFNQVQKYIGPVTAQATNYTAGEFSRDFWVEPDKEGNGEEPVTVFGIDVSHWQGLMNWETAKNAGVKWAYIKATEGDNFVGSQFARNWTETKKNGVYRGIYHFYNPWIDARVQAEHFVSKLPEDWDLPPAIDLEDTRNASRNEDEHIQAFLLHFEQLTGVKPVVYTSAGYWNTIVGNVSWASNYDLWVANWRVTAPRLPLGWNAYKFWQYDVIIAGPQYGAQSERIDVNVFNGTTEEFLNYINLPQDTCLEIPPFTSTVIMRPRELAVEQAIWLDKAMSTGVDVDGKNRVVGTEGWSVDNAFKDILDAIDAGKTDSRLLILDGHLIGTGLTPEWMRANCPKLLKHTRWYKSSPVIEPEPEPTPGDIDMLSYMLADPTAFRVVKSIDASGNENQEDVQDMLFGADRWVRRKNDRGEWWRWDSKFIYLIHDTSPAPATTGPEAGVDRVYTLYKNGVPGAPKNPLRMTRNAPWVESGQHTVQFRAKDGCRDLSTNSGGATNRATVVQYATNYSFNTYGQNLVFDEVIWVNTGVEMQIYGKKGGKSCGWIGWQAPWGSAEPVELYFDRGIMSREPHKYCSF